MVKNKRRLLSTVALVVGDYDLLSLLEDRAKRRAEAEDRNADRAVLASMLAVTMPLQNW